MSYYAVCNVNGPISVELSGETEAEAMVAFVALDTRRAIDAASVDIEDALEIEGASGMSEAAFATRLEEAGARHVRSLAEVHNAHAGTTAHLAGGWSLWVVDPDVLDDGAESAAQFAARVEERCGLPLRRIPDAPPGTLWGGAIVCGSPHGKLVFVNAYDEDPDTGITQYLNCVMVDRSGALDPADPDADGYLP